MNQQSTDELREIAKSVNTRTDLFNEKVAEIETFLQSLNLGMTTWIQVPGNLLPIIYAGIDIEFGYAKVLGKWGLVLRIQATEETWLLRDAPRRLRFVALACFYDLFKELLLQAQKLHGEVSQGLNQAEEVLRTLKGS